MTALFSEPVYLNALGIVCSLGADKASVRAAMFENEPHGISLNNQLMPGSSVPVGMVTAPLASLDVLANSQHSRNNALVLTALQQIRNDVDAAIERFGSNRVAIVLGTSTAGIGESENAVAHFVTHRSLPTEFHLAKQELGSPAVALSSLLGLSGPMIVISTACSSSAKALTSAARLLRAGMCDAVITGGMDSLCAFTLAGFSSLESVSKKRCNPLSANRDGINIGEGGALFLMTRESGPVCLAGWGESSDAYHISAPAPDGRGATSAMQAALKRAGITSGRIDYVNLHGTATLQNDAMESKAVHALFGVHTPVSSTKPLTGHTLGGAGAIEAALCWLLLTNNEQGKLPIHLWDGIADPTFPALNVVQHDQNLGRPAHYIMSNSFAFGGSNASLILRKNN